MTLLMKRSKRVFSWSLEMITSGGQITENVFMNIRQVYLGSAFNIEKAFLKNFSMKDSELVQFIFELRKSWVPRDKKAKEMDSH